MIPEFGKFLRIKRMQTGMSLCQMAAKLDRAPTLLSAIELGKQYCTDEVLAKICKLFELSEQESKDLDDLRIIALKGSRPLRVRIKEEDKAFFVKFARMLADNRPSDEELEAFLNKKEGKK